MKKQVAVAVVVASGVLAAGAWAATGPGVAAPARCAWDDVIGDRSQIGLNRLVNDSHAAVVATVVAVSPARWNSPDGQEWCPALSDPRGKHVFRDVTLRVSSPVFDSAALRARPGRQVTVRIFGDGSGRGEVAAVNPDGSAIYESDVDGTFAVGGRVLVLLARVDNFPMAHGPVTVNQVVGSWLGNWAVDSLGNKAVSVQPERTVPLDALLARLKTERRLGRAPARDVTSAVNPLG